MENLLNFPPFFTKQPNEQTWQTQREKWISLILTHCKTHKIWTISPVNGTIISHSSTITPIPNIFKNDKINRSLDSKTIDEILKKMIADGDAELIEPSVLLIYWNKPEIWGSLILEYVERNGLNGTVLTLMDLSESDEIVNEEFNMIYEPLLIKSLENLKKRGRAQLMKDENGVIAGVKIQ